MLSLTHNKKSTIVLFFIDKDLENLRRQRVRH
ncbi:hypothetical protein DN35_2601 [Vibrio cholerae]|nr:hypothetical protein DN35_2601 [Vibrio cholerae]KFE08327.1 hypothetical protein DN36_2702 [Vibrio cholerae]